MLAAIPTSPNPRTATATRCRGNTLNIAPRIRTSAPLDRKREVKIVFAAPPNSSRFSAAVDPNTTTRKPPTSAQPANTFSRRIRSSRLSSRQNGANAPMLVSVAKRSVFCEPVVVYRGPVQADREHDRDHKQRQHEHERGRCGPAAEHSLQAHEREQDPERHGGVEWQDFDHRLLLEQPDVAEDDQEHQRVPHQQRDDQREYRHAEGKRAEQDGEQGRQKRHGAAHEDEGSVGLVRRGAEVEGPRAHCKSSIGS